MRRGAIVSLVAGVAISVTGGSIALTLAQESGGPEGDSPEEVAHKVPEDVGDFYAIEVPEGLTYRREVSLALAHGSVTLPRAYGLVWGFGDTECGYGWVVDLPAGTVVCFDEDRAEVQVSIISKDDAGLVARILDSVIGYRLRPSRTTGELP